MLGEMKKDFDKWHKLKIYIEDKNVYFERPVLILRKFNKEIFWGLPMSTKIKENEFHFKYSFDNDENATILLSQIRLMSSKILIRRLVTINRNTFSEIRKAVNKLIKNESDSIRDTEESSGA
jgi:mRNA interferase MazF